MGFIANAGKANLPTVPFRQDRRTPRRYNYLFPRPRSVQHLMTRNHRRSWNRSQAAVHRRDWDGPPARRLRALRPPDPPCRRERRGAGPRHRPRRPDGHPGRGQNASRSRHHRAGHRRPQGLRPHPPAAEPPARPNITLNIPGKSSAAIPPRSPTAQGPKRRSGPKRVTHRWIQAKRDTGIGNSGQANSWSTLGDLDAFCRRARARRDAASRRSQPHCHRRPSGATPRMR